MKFNWPKFNRYKVAHPGYKIVLNKYDYRPNGGSLYIIGIAILVGDYCYGIRWGTPGRNFGSE